MFILSLDVNGPHSSCRWAWGPHAGPRVVVLW